MRVGIISWRELADPAWGGSEVLVDRVATGFVERGWEVALLCGGPTAPRPYRVVPNGGRYGQYLRAPITGRRLGPLDVVIDVSNGIPFFSPIWQRRPAICLVHHVHTQQWSDALPRPAAAFGAMLERRVVPRIYRRFWSVSPSTTRSLVAIGVPRERIREAWNGIDVPRDLPSPVVGDPATYVAISRLVPHKGVDRILDAWAASGVDGELVVIGDGPLRAELEARRTPRVRFLGHVAEDAKQQWVSRARALVHGAHHEGWGIVIMEAAAHGVPTLAFDVPGVRDAVVNGDTGLLAHSVGHLSELWRRLADSPELRETLGRKAWERASTLSWDACVESAAALVTDAHEGAW